MDIFQLLIRIYTTETPVGKLKFVVHSLQPYIEKARLGGIFYDDNLIEIFLKSLGE